MLIKTDNLKIVCQVKEIPSSDKEYGHKAKYFFSFTKLKGDRMKFNNLVTETMKAVFSTK